MLTVEELRDQYSDEISDLVEYDSRRDLTINQRLLYHFTANALERLEGNRKENHLLTELRTPLMVGCVFLFAWGCLGFVYLLTHWLLGHYTDWLLYPVSALGGIYIIERRREHESSALSLTSDDEGRITGLKLGRLEHFFDSSGSSMGFDVGLMTGAVAGLVQFTHDSVGIEGVSGFQDAFLISLDCAVRSIFWDVFDLYGIYFGPETEFTPWGATVFMFFRVFINLGFVFHIYTLWNRIRLDRLIRRLSGADDAYELSERLTDIRKSRWSGQFLDEYTFLIAADHYLAGCYEEVCRLTEIYPRTRFHWTIRDLFITPDGRTLSGFDYALPD